MIVIVSVVLLFVVLIFGFVVRLSLDVYAIRQEILADIRKILQQGPLAHGHQVWFKHAHWQGAITNPGVFVIWKWRDGKWHPVDVPEGMDPGIPPGYPGAMNGDIAKTWVATNR